MQNNRSSITGGISAGIVIIGIALALAFGGFNLTIFFVALAFSGLIGSLSSRNANGLYGGIQGFIWLMALALFFATGFSWIWFLVATGLSMILGSLIKPIVAALGGMSFLGLNNQTPVYQPPQPVYQPPQQPNYQPYQEGYQPPQAEAYEEGGQQHPYPHTPPSSQEYEQPQAQYPQEMPPMQ